jgi:hypothetical protein
LLFFIKGSKAAKFGLLLLLVLGAFGYAYQRFVEIDVERINVREPDGRLAMVIANAERIPGLVFQGDELRERPSTHPGMIFYNTEETETGGLIFGGEDRDSVRWGSGHLSFDRINQDQVLNMTYSEQGSVRSAGYFVNDQPALPMNELIAIRDSARGGSDSARAQIARLSPGPHTRRFFAGTITDPRSDRDDVTLSLHDKQGRSRIRISVDADGVIITCVSRR